MNSKLGHQKIKNLTKIFKNIKLDEIKENVVLEKPKTKIITYNQIIKDGWVHIDKLFEYTKGKTRSELFQTALAIDRDLKSKYEETFNHVTTHDFLRLRNFMRLYKPGLKMIRVTKYLRNEKFKTQALDDILLTTKNTCVNVVHNFVAAANLPSSITRATEKAAVAMDNLTNTTKRFDTMLIEVQGIIKTVTESFSGVLKNAMHILIWLLKIMAFINLIRQKQNQDLTSIASLITLILPVETGELLLSQITVLPLAVKGIVSYFKDGFKAESGDEQHATIVKAFYYMIRDMVVTLFSGADKVKYAAMKLNQDKVRYFVTAISTTKTIHGYFLELIKHLLEFFKIDIFNFKSQDGLLTQEVFTKFFDDYYGIRKNNIHELARVSSQHAKRIDLLYKDGLNMSAALSKALLTDEGKELRAMVAPLRTVVNDLDEMLKLIPRHVLNGEETRRNKPYWLYIFGEPRIGKSAFFQPLLVNELVTRLNLTPDYQNLSTYTYFRRCGNEFWDGYSNQLVTWYNDIFQMNSRAEEVIQTISELTDVVDDNPCIVNMAHVDLKDRVFFDSKLVVSNAQNDLPQQQFLANNCWSGGRHILARRNCVVEFCLSPNYTLTGSIGIDKQKLYQAMKDDKIEKITSGGVQLVPIDMYYLRIRHVITGATIRTVDLVTGLNLIVDDMINYMSGQDDFKNRLYGFFRQRFDERDGQGVVLPLKNQTFRVSTECIASRMRPIIRGEMPTTPKQNNETSSDTLSVTTIQVEPRISPTVRGKELSPKKNLKTQADDDFQSPNETTPHNELTPEEENEIAQKWLAPRSCKCADRAKQYLATYPQTDRRLRVELYYAGKHKCIKDNAEILERLIMEFNTDWDADTPKTPWYEDIYKMGINIASNIIKKFVDGIRESLPYIAIAAAYVMIILVITLAATWYEHWLNTGVRTKKKDIKRPSVNAETSEFTTQNKQPRLVRKAAKAETSEVTQNFKAAKLRRRVMKTETYDEQNVCVEQRIKSHFCRLTLYCLDNDKKIVFPQVANMLAVAGNVFVTPKHYYLRHQQLKELAKEHGYELKYELLTQSNTTIHMPLTAISWFLNSSSNYSQDLAFCRISRGTAYKDLTRFFLREKESVNLTGCYLYGLRSPIINGTNLITSPTILPVNQTSIEDVEYDTGEAPCVFEGTTLNNIEFVGVMNYLYSNNLTVKGDCGMLLMHSDSAKNCRKILGMHVAGSPNTSEGVAAPIFAEDIEEALVYFNKMERIITTECFENMEYTYDQNTLTDELNNVGIQIVGTLKDTIIQGEKVKGYINLPRTTNINKSVVFEQMQEVYGPTTLMPAKLRPFKQEGIVLSPLLIALKKYETHPMYINEKDFIPIRDSIIDAFETARTYNMINRRVLTDFEAINGFGSMKQMDMSTSAGYPYCNRSHNGKHFWFERTVLENGASIFTMKDYLKQQVQQRLEKAEKGECAETYFIDTLKDETRPIEKVKMGKTRVFQIGPVDLTILMRQYFGSFIDFCHSSYIKNEIAVGCNPNSSEWVMKLRKFQKIGSRGWDGDFENYDASLWSQMVDMVCEIINTWYHGNEKDNLVRRVLMKTLVFSHHIVENLVFMLYGGNPSGNVLTTILNCVVFMIMIRLFYREQVNKDLSDFSYNVAVWTFGDDNLTIFRKHINKSMEDARLFFLKYNMKYTSADKTEIKNEMILLKDMSFLKRKWVEVENEIMAPIDKKVILEIPRWSEGDASNMENQLQRFNAALLEISNYGKNEFRTMRNNFIIMIRKLNETGLFIPINRLFTYERCYDIKRPELTKLSPLNNADLDGSSVTAYLPHATLLGEND